jgi:pimeloyl-ACP methyl ester carboxylesterase
MKGSRTRTLFALAAAALSVAASSAIAQLQTTTSTTVTAQLNANGNTNVLAAKLRRPATDLLGHAHVAVLFMHPYSGYQNFAMCDGLAARGYTTLCLDSTFTGRQYDYYGYEQHAPAIRAGIDYLRALGANATLPAISRVVIFGHSMGAPLMAFYENVAENGAAAACQGAEKIIPCVGTNLQNLPRADGVMLFDPHLGDALATFTYVDPALEGDVNTCGPRKAQVDMFSAANSYVSDPGALDDNSASYSKHFSKDFLVHQAVRNADVLKAAQQLLAERRRATGNPDDMGDDVPFDVPGANGARLWQPDTGLLKSTQNAHILLARDGTRPVRIISSVRPPSGNLPAADCGVSTVETSLHAWLGAHALDATPGRYDQTVNDITGVKYTSSATSTVNGVLGFDKPLLIISNTGHYFLRPAEIVFENAITTDKTVAYSEGAVHGGTPCAQCTRIILNNPALGNAAANAYWTDPLGNGPLERSMNFMAEWLGARY